MGVAVSALGLAIVAVALHDIFHTLFHPSGEGRLSRTIVATTWRVLRRADRRWSTLVLAGPIGMLNVIVSWVALIAGGFAVFLWPHLERHYAAIAPLDGPSDGFADALYVSVVTLATLGYGDVVPESTFFRLVAPLESVIGFVLLTAAISWVLSIYPALHRLRRLANAAFVLEDARARVPQAPLAAELARLADGVTEARVDFVQHPVIYYFQSPDPRSSLAAALPRLARLADERRRGASPEERLAATRLAVAVDDLTAAVARDFLGHSEIPTMQALAAYAADHAVEIEDDAEDERGRSHG